MNLHTLVRITWNAPKHELSGAFITTEPFSSININDARISKENNFFLLTLEYGTKNIGLKVPASSSLRQFQQLGKNVPLRIFHVTEVDSKIGKISLKWTPVGEDSNRGLLLELVFEHGYDSGTYTLKILKPEKFKYWENQTKQSRGIVAQPYTSR